MRQIWAFLVVVLLLAGWVGCNRGSDLDNMVAKATDSNIKRLSKMYSMCMKNNDWRGPENRQALHSFIARLNPDQLRAMGIEPDDIDSIFVCERDNVPFKIRWNLRSSILNPPLPIIFESTPSSQDLYQVGFLGNIVKEVDQSEYDRLWNGEGDHPGGDRQKKYR